MFGNFIIAARIILSPESNIRKRLDEYIYLIYTFVVEVLIEIIICFLLVSCKAIYHIYSTLVKKIMRPSVGFVSSVSRKMTKIL